MAELYCLNCMSPISPGVTLCPHCRRKPFPPAVEGTLPPGTMLQEGSKGTYLIGRVLGQGGFGITYLGRDMRFHNKVAVKEYFPRHLCFRTGHSCALQWHSSAAERDLGKESFVKEAMKMAKVDQISGIVQVKDYFYENDTAYIVMAFVEGETLKQYLDRTGRIHPQTALELLDPVMNALTEAHGYGLIHRDIKPDNIMRDSRGRVWVLDLGAAKELDNPNIGEGQSTNMVVSHGFSPIEQYSTGSMIGAWTDVYALAATFFYCVTGSPPPLSTDRVMQDTLQFPSFLPPPLCSVLGRAMAIRPENRIRSIPEFQSALRNALSSRPVPPNPPDPKVNNDNDTVLLDKDPHNRGGGKKKPLPTALLAGLGGAAAFALVFALLYNLILNPDSGSGGTGGRAEPLPQESSGTSVSTSEPITLPTTPSTEETSEPAEPVSAQPEQEEARSGKCGAYVNWDLDGNGQLTISGSGVMTDYKYDDTLKMVNTPWWDFRDEILSLRIEEGVTTIGDEAFDSLGNLNQVQLPSSLRSIGHYAFDSCKSLTTITLPDSVTEMGGGIFARCKSLKTVHLPRNLLVLGEQTFYTCEVLTQVEIPDGVADLGNHAFTNCSALKSVSLPRGLQTINKGAFQGCYQLEQVNYGGSQKEWSSVIIAEDNSPLDDAKLNCALADSQPSSTEEKLAYFIAHCHEEYFNWDDIEGFNADQAWTARNAVFARSGRKFVDAYWQSYFAQFDWYSPIYEPDYFDARVESLFNSYQKANKDLMVQYCNSKGYTSRHS